VQSWARHATSFAQVRQKRARLMQNRGTAC